MDGSRGISLGRRSRDVAGHTIRRLVGLEDLFNERVFDGGAVGGRVCHRVLAYTDHVLVPLLPLETFDAVVEVHPRHIAHPPDEEHLLRTVCATGPAPLRRNVQKGCGHWKWQRVCLSV